MSYKHILVAVDLNENHEPLIEKAFALAGAAKVTVVHVMEAWNYLLVAEDVDWGAQANVASELHQRLRCSDEEKLVQLRHTYKLAEEATLLLEGKPAAEIKRLAQELEVDLIVCGTHGRHGLGMILGSVSSGIMHGTPCDVLAVKV